MVDATTWLTEANPRMLLEFLHDRSLLSRRKDRLIACACCRKAWPLLTDERNVKGNFDIALDTSGIPTLDPTLGWLGYFKTGASNNLPLGIGKFGTPRVRR